MTKHLQMVVLGFGVLCVSAGAALTWQAFSLQAQLFENMQATPPIMEDPEHPAAVGDGFSEGDSTMFVEPTPGNTMEPFVSEPAIGEGQFMESTGEDEWQTFTTGNEAPIFMESQQSSAPEMIQEQSSISSTPLGGKVFYRAGKEAVINTDSSEPFVPENSSSTSSAAEITFPVIDTGAVIAPTTDTENEVPNEEVIPEPTQNKTSVVGMIRASTPLVVTAGIAIGGIFYFLFLRKKKPKISKTIPPTPAAISTAAEETSPRLEQALKAIQAEHIPTPPLPSIPQEGSSPAAPGQVSPA